SHSSRASLFACLFADLIAFHFTLRTLDFPLGFAHRDINLTLRLTLCLPSYPFSINLNSHFLSHSYGDVHIVRFFSLLSSFGFALKRRSGTQRESVGRARYPDSAVDVAEFDLWTTSAD